MNPKITVSFPITFPNTIFSILLTEASFNSSDSYIYNNSYFGSNMVQQNKNQVTITSNRSGMTTAANLYIGI